MNYYQIYNKKMEDIQLQINKSTLEKIIYKNTSLFFDMAKVDVGSEITREQLYKTRRLNQVYIGRYNEDLVGGLIGYGE